MSVRIISKKREPREVLVKLVDGSTVRGKINLYNEEVVLQRVSDIFTKVPDPFIVVYDAIVEGKTDQVMIINKSNIIWVSPED
jgi:small nuclear ribonucleoprotein (snRNP)-like protein